MTDKIKRWEMYCEPNYDIVSSATNDDGKWVLFKDHLKAIEAKNKTIEAQAKEIERIDRIFRKKIKNRDMRHESIVFRLEQKIARLKREKAGLETAVIAKGMGL